MRRVLERLQDSAAADRQNLATSFRLYSDVIDTDEAAESDSPVLDEAVKEGGPEGVRVLTNFSLSEFNELFSVVEESLRMALCHGKGRKTKTTPKDALLMALSGLKYYDTWAKHAYDFDIKAPTFEKLMTKVFDTITPVLAEAFIRPTTMTKQRAEGKSIKQKYISIPSYLLILVVNSE
ncbi:hypothetical protein BBJ28_00000434 [Nothophytophthora sp. Chile5]|nr:hypothetical protein BBJ28_00000434 [Nothophytophthora sp. Chile5]